MVKEEGVKSRTMQSDLAAINSEQVFKLPVKSKVSEERDAKKVLKARPRKKNGQIELPQKVKKSKNNAILWTSGAILTITLIIIWILIFIS